MNDQALLEKARDYLAEYAGIEPWSHLHCDEIDGHHRLIGEWLDDDAAILIAEIDVRLNS